MPIRFDPEGTGYDVETAKGIIEKYPLTTPKPDRYEGDMVGNRDASFAFEKWVWHPELNDYLKHGSSLDPSTGMVLKGRKHKTYYLTEETEKGLGSQIRKREDGRYYAVSDDPITKEIERMSEALR